MRKKVSRFRKRYFGAERGLKGQIVVEAYHELIRGGATRFLKRVDNDQWVVVDKETAIAKVGHCLRCIRNFKNQKPEPDEDVPRVNNCRNDQRASRSQYQFPVPGEPASLMSSMSTFRTWRNAQQLFTPSTTAMSEALLLQRLQYRYYELALSQYWLIPRDLLQLRYGSSPFDLCRGLISDSDVQAMVVRSNLR